MILRSVGCHEGLNKYWMFALTKPSRSAGRVLVSHERWRLCTYPPALAPGNQLIMHWQPRGAGAYMISRTKVYPKCCTSNGAAHEHGPSRRHASLEP